MAQLSVDAIRVLRDIHSRGLQVLWSFKVPYPQYDDGTDMPRSDWQIADRELWRIELEEGVLITGKKTTINRISIRQGVRLEETIRVSPDGGETVIERQVVHSEMFASLPDQIISEETTIETDTVPYKNWKWVSDYITREQIEQDDYTEEFVGSLNRYSLTPKAVELIRA